MFNSADYMLNVHIEEKDDSTDWLGFVGMDFHFMPAGYKVIVEFYSWPKGRLMPQGKLVFKSSNGKVELRGVKMRYCNRDVN